MSTTLDVAGGGGGGEIPHHFRCPISLDIMSDPVTVSTGHTFDRPSIESWLSTGNSTCPVTRSPLSDTSPLIPNLTLRRLIHTWRLSHPFLSTTTATAPKPPPADPSLLRSLLSRSSPTSTLPVPARVTALTRLSQLVCDSDENRSILSSIPHCHRVLISILFSAESDSAELINHSLSLLAMFRLGETESDSVSSDPDRIRFLINLMAEPNPIETRTNAAAVIESVLSGASSLELKSKITAADGVYEGVVSVITAGIKSRRSAKIGVKALFSLCLEKKHRGRAVAAGAVEAIINLIAYTADMERGESERALATAELICRVPEGCAAFAAHPMAAGALVRTIMKVSGRATEHAAGALLAVCTESVEARKEAVGEGAVARLLLVVQSGGTERGRRKARLLLKLLRDSWLEDSVGKFELDFCCSDVVPYSIRK